MGNSIIITRHTALVEYLREIGLADESTPVLPHATVDDVRGKTVIGPVPLHMAVHARSVVQIPIRWDRTEERGRELTLDEVRARAGEPVEYKIALEESGTLAAAREIAQAQEAVPGATSAWDAAGRVCEEWAREHGLESYPHPYTLTTTTTISIDQAEKLVKLSNIPPPRFGKIEQVLISRGLPCVQISVEIGRVRRSNCYVVMQD